MLKYILFIVVIVLGLCGICNFSNVFAGNYSVGTIFQTSQFPNPLSRYGCMGYFALEPYGLPHTSSNPIYHTTTNHSKYGSETIVCYWGNSTIELRIYKWVPSGRGYIDNLHGTTNNSSWHSPATKSIGNSNGNIDSNFAKYTTILTLDGESKKVVRIQNVSDWNSGNNTWREITRLYNYNTSSWETLMDISWNGSVSDNHSTTSTQGMWGGALETFDSGYSSYGGKKAGNYSMNYLKPKPDGTWEWTPMVFPFCTLRTYDSATGLRVINQNPLPSYWLATVL